MRNFHIGLSSKAGASIRRLGLNYGAPSITTGFQRPNKIEPSIKSVRMSRPSQIVAFGLVLLANGVKLTRFIEEDANEVPCQTAFGAPSVISLSRTRGVCAYNTRSYANMLLIDAVQWNMYIGFIARKRFTDDGKQSSLRICMIVYST